MVELLKYAFIELLKYAFIELLKYVFFKKEVFYLRVV